jgi:hypothetical protein
VIESDCLDLTPGEKKIKEGLVYIESNDRPSSNTGKGIPKIYLLLTTKRLFFFYTGKEQGNLGKRAAGHAITAAARLFDQATFGLSHYAQAAVEYGLENWNKPKSSELEEAAAHGDSFLIHLEQISACDKYDGLLSSKKKYIKIKLQNNPGSFKTYCIYSVDPLNPSTLIDYKDWYKKIERARLARIHLPQVFSRPNSFPSMGIEAISYTTFRSSSMGIQLIYPDHWSKKDASNYVVFSPALLDLLEKKSISFEVHMIRAGEDPILPRSDTALENIVQYEIRFLTSQTEDFKLEQIVNMDINGAPGKLITYVEKDVIQCKVNEYIVVKNGKLYVSLFSAPISLYDAYKPIINQIVNSILIE